MNILDELNKKVSLYQSPKLNWLTKRAWLFNTVHIAAVATMFLGGTVWMDSLTSSPSSMEIVLTLVFIFFVAPLYVIGLSTLFFKYKYPLQEKVVEEYTGYILKSFSESQYHEIKMKLLKILNNEPYTPVSFLDDILQYKNLFDKQQNGKECVKSVEEPVSLTVLIEKMEQQENESLSEKEAAYKKHIESISKL